MGEAYFLSRGELLSWINGTLDLRLGKVEEVSSAQASRWRAVCRSAPAAIAHQPPHRCRMLLAFADSKWSCGVPAAGRPVPWRGPHEEGEGQAAERLRLEKQPRPLGSKRQPTAHNSERCSPETAVDADGRGPGASTVMMQ